MKRRDLIAGVAGGVAASPRAEAGPSAQTVYIPPAHRIEDVALLHDFMESYPFADLITTAPTLRISHIPVWLDRKAGQHGVTYGHVARNNPQSHAFDDHNGAVIVFHGPHGYISPSWYDNPNSVPTWNFAAVHATGKPHPISYETELRTLLNGLVARSEHTYAEGKYDFDRLPSELASGLMKGIVGFRMEIELLEGKFKLGQERSEADRNSIVDHLRRAKPERSLAEVTAAFYSWQKKNSDRQD